MNGAELISAERERQILKEGWNATHDDNEHGDGELVYAAICYAGTHPDGDNIEPEDWPWHSKWWKPSMDQVRNLVKAGALIAAEIDRLLRANPTNKESLTVAEPEPERGKDYGMMRLDDHDVLGPRSQSEARDWVKRFPRVYVLVSRTSAGPWDVETVG